MKIKALIKAMTKSKKHTFGDKYCANDNIIIDGCFVPYSKAREDKRKVDSFYIGTTYANSIVQENKHIELVINIEYIKEKTARKLEEIKVDKKKKKKDKDKKKK